MNKTETKRKIEYFIFLNAYIIENDKWNLVYEKANKQFDMMELSVFNTMLLEAGIPVLNHLDRIPSNFLVDSDISCAVKIPDNIEYIGERAFIHCHQLTDVTIGDGVTKIGASAFSGHNV